MYEQYTDDITKIQAFPDGKLFRLLFDHSMNMLRVIAKSSDRMQELRNAFSVENKAAFFSQQYGYKGIPRLYNVNPFGYFHSGLVYDILDWIKTNYGSLNCLAVSKNCAAYIKDVLTPLNVTDLSITNVSDENGRNEKAKAAGRPEYKMRPYQEEAVRQILTSGHGRGLIEIPTAGGKSFILANLVWNISKLSGRMLKTMILVPNVQLVEQFYKDLLDYGYGENQLAKFAGGMSKKERARNDVKTADVIIANRQFLFKNKDILSEIELLIADECHTCNSESTAQLIASTPAKFKIGCSGTIPSDRYLRNQLIGMFGRVVYREEISDLQRQGFITKLKITSFSVTDMNVENDRQLLFNVRSLRKYNAEDLDSEIRFDDAVKAEHEYFATWYKELYRPVLDHVSTLDGNTLVLFDKLDVGRSLFDYFGQLYPDKRIYYNDGSTDVKEREENRSGFEQRDSNVMFANVQILSTGVNIKRLHNIVFCFGSKSTTRVIQSIGRALRLYGDKEYANLIDVHFNFKYSDRHYRERLKMYSEFYKKSKPDVTISKII